jgi:NitT/TauT family transport system permease protein
VIRDHHVLPDRHQHDRGLKAADARILDLMHSINATGAQVFFKVQLPSALPFIFAGFRIARR